ncbi:hypothetical protein [Polynucleobacter antarcticus]|nr:hypothetical protein [Polynucleobacter antarcticus]
MKATQTGILWSQVQVLVDALQKQALIKDGESFVLGPLQVVTVICQY